MKISEARYRANQRWDNANLEQINIKVRKGHKDEIKAAANTLGESVNAFVTKAIDERIGGLRGVSAKSDNVMPALRGGDRSRQDTHEGRKRFKGLAHHDYTNGMTAADISKKYGISVRAVAAWIGQWKTGNGDVNPKSQSGT